MALAIETLLDLARKEQEEFYRLYMLLKPRLHVCQSLVRKAELEGQLCPISMEPITLQTASCVGPCYHIFHRAAIYEWRKRSNLCPVCRELCFLAEAQTTSLSTSN